MLQQESEIGRYRVVRRVGAGGMACTFLCTLDGMGGFQKYVVIKMLDPERIDDTRYVSMFLDEARLWAKFSHPNIPQAFELGDFEGVPYIVMEYVPGPTLHLLSRKIGVRTPHTMCMIARIGAEVARALDYAYYGVSSEGTQLKVVHRDVTLNNILLSTGGRAKLIDFGIAMADGRIAQTEVGTLKGRVQYMAPEQLLDKPVDHRTDLFQLGITLYHLVTGRAAYNSDSKSPAAMWKARMDADVLPVLTAAPNCPPELAALIEQCIEHEPEARPERGAALADALDALIAAHSPKPIEPTDLAAWVAELFPNQEWTASTGGLNTLNTGSIAPTTGTGRLGSRTTGVRSGTPVAVQPSTQSAPLSRGRLAVVATLLGGLAVSGVVIVALSGLLIATQVGETPQPPAPAQATAQAPVDPNRAATVYLDEVERLLSVDRPREAGQFLLNARNAAPTDPEVVVRLSRVGSVLEDKLLLTAAQQALAARDLDTAAERAREMLDRQPTHQGALAILTQVAEAREQAAKAAEPAAAAQTGKEEPVKLKGQLFITSNPPAQVFIDDRPYGQSPISGVQLPAGPHTVYLRLADHAPAKRSITIRGNDKVRLNVTLEALSDEPETASNDRISSLVAEVAPEPPAPASPPPDATAAAPVPDAAAAAAPVEAPAPSRDAVADAALPAPAPAPAPAAAPAPASAPQGTEMASDVPLSKQALVLTRALSFDKNLPSRAGGKLVIASLYTDATTKKRALRMNTEFSNFGLKIQGMPLTTTALEFTSGSDLAAAITSQGIDVIYVPTGMGAQVAAVAQVARSANVLTIGAEPSYVRSGLALGVFVKDGAPVLALHQGAATAEGASFGGEILQVAVKMD